METQVDEGYHSLLIPFLIAARFLSAMNSNPTDLTQFDHIQFGWWDSPPVNAPGTPPPHPVDILRIPEVALASLQPSLLPGPSQQVTSLIEAQISIIDTLSERPSS